MICFKSAAGPHGSAADNIQGEKKMVKKYFKENVFTLRIALFCIAIIACIPNQIRVGLTAKASISPRLFPYFSTIGALVCCICSLLMEALKYLKISKDGGTVEESPKDDNVRPIRAVISIVLLLIWWAVLKKIGFIISTILITFFLSYMLGNRNKVVLIAFPVIFTLLIYFVFSFFLHVNLPEILF